MCWGGFEFVKGKCVLACGPNEVREYGDCVCRKGFKRINGGCVIIPKTPKPKPYKKPYGDDYADSYKDDGYGDDYKSYGGDDYKSYGGDDYKSYGDDGYEKKPYKKPEPKCPRNSSWVAAQKECVCWNGYRKGDYGCERICEELQWYQVSSDSCITCPPLSLFDPAFDKCRCTGIYEMVNGKCVLPKVKTVKTVKYEKPYEAPYEAPYKSSTKGYKSSTKAYKSSTKAYKSATKYEAPVYKTTPVYDY